MWGRRPMRGGDVRSEALFSYVSYERRVPVDHPLRPIRKIVDDGLLLPAVPILLMTSPRSAQSLPRGDCTTHRWRKGFEPSVPLATVSLILAEEKGLQADPA